MNDIITPMGFDITKKLHGHVRVETRSRWTGRVVDSQEKDNLITNACQLMLQTQAWYQGSGMSANWTPIYEKLLGGIMLFDNTLTEQASNIAFPSGVKIVGFAGQEANADNPMAGSFNANESVKTSNGFTTVWDFLTSQANGTIASLARTSYQFAKNFVNRTSVSTNFFNYNMGTQNPPALVNYAFLGYDDTNKYIYLAARTTQTILGVSYPTTKIFRIKQDFGKVGLLNMQPPAADMDVVKTLTSSDGTTTAANFLYDKYANNFIYANGTTLHIVSIDGTHTSKTLTGTAGTLAVTENYYWRAGSSVVYRISKTNTADIGSYSISNAAYIAPIGNDVVAVWDSSYNMSFLYPDGTVKTMGNAVNLYSNSYLQVGPFYSMINANSSIYLNPSANYLGTIANLDSPVTKTSSQTMKITYTLTEA